MEKSTGKLSYRPILALLLISFCFSSLACHLEASYQQPYSCLTHCDGCVAVGTSKEPCTEAAEVCTPPHPPDQIASDIVMLRLRLSPDPSCLMLEQKPQRVKCSCWRRQQELWIGGLGGEAVSKQLLSAVALFPLHSFPICIGIPKAEGNFDCGKARNETWITSLG